MESVKLFLSTLSGSARVLIGIVLSIISFFYLLPTGIAIIRNRENTAAIFVLNLFLGWSVVGWVVALVWAVKSVEQRVVYVKEQ